MAIEIVRYSAEHRDEVGSFNQRLVEGGEGDYQLPVDLRQFEESAGGPLPWEGWLARQDGVVRGGYLLRKQQFSFAGDVHTVAFYNLSPSEGAIDRAYASISLKMVSSAMAKEPLMFALGMGGLDKRLPQFLKALGWKLHEVPFLFRLVRPGLALRNIASVRTTRLRRIVLDTAAFTGAAWAGIGAVQAFRRRGLRVDSQARTEETPDFGPWADEIWRACGHTFAMIGVRDRCALNALYPKSMPRLARLKIFSGDKLIGWAVVLNTRMKAHKQFGGLHVGTLVDCLSRHEDAPVVAEAARRFLESRGVDIIVSNQCHPVWRSALRQTGFFEGPTNYILAASRGLAKMLDPFETRVSEAHITRGDGDGPIHL
jgi:hypothetical protein